MEANKIQHVEEQMWYPYGVIFPTQIDAASMQEPCVANVGHQREYADDKQSFVSVEYPGDGRAA
eukprot:9675570-Ditylum_brightwellii.AAC.1